MFDNVEALKDMKTKLMIYYKNRKLRNLFIRNNLNPPTEQFNVVYKYTCNQVQCTSAHITYIGHTKTTLKERFKQHSSIKKHFKDFILILVFVKL